jgi:hypothetical protein
MLHRIDAITADIAAVQQRIDNHLAELAPAVVRLSLSFNPSATGMTEL